MGCYCTFTKRLIKLNEEEISFELKKIKSKIKIGQGKDEVEITSNKTDNNHRVMIIGGPCACPVSEEIFIEVMQSYAKEMKVNGVMPGKLTKIKGRDILPRTTMEMYATREEAFLTRVALNQVNRPGMPILGIVSVSSEATNFSYGSDGLRESDLHEVDPINELKIDFETLKRILFCKRNNLLIASIMCPIVGGYAGGPEETAIVSVAEALQSFTIIGAQVFILAVNDVNTGCGTDTKNLWVSGSVLLALKTAHPFILGTLIWMASGPCTEMIFYEVCTKTLVDSSCGSDIVVSAGCTRGRLIDCYTGMEAKIAAEVAHVTQKLGFNRAIEISNELLNHYEKKILNGEIPSPKSFKDCYSIEGPTKDYLDIWESFKKKLIDLGLEI